MVGDMMVVVADVMIDACFGGWMACQVITFDCIVEY